MSAIPQASLASHKLLPASNDLNRLRHNAAALVIPSPKVLLDGRNTSWGAVLQRSLEKIGCEIFLAPTLRLTCEYARKGAYTVILLDSKFSPEQRGQIVSVLVGSNTSMFHVFPVEIGCRWLPVMLSGQECFGSAGFRTKEFFAWMKRTLQGAP